jgi:ribosomal protein S18 acetylase RimI-like enzyme
MSATEALHKAVDGPHWYLMAIGTRPEVQGTGLGSALVELGTAQADKAGIPCYLETGTESNVAFYRKRGFEVTGQAEMYGFTVYGMVRQPQ